MGKDALNKFTHWFSSRLSSTQPVDYKQEMMFLNQEHRYFESVIGGWPARIESESQREQIIKRWQAAVKRTHRLAKSWPYDYHLLWLAGELYRMGHNADIPDVIHAAIEIFERIIAYDPQCFAALFSLARLYLNSVPDRAAEAEQLLLRAKEMARPELLPDITAGLFYACLYQKKQSEAIMYLESYLCQRPEHTEMAKLLEKVKNGQYKVVFKPLSAR
jgi:tetratricopeptide (TPR) repeat protein